VESGDGKQLKCAEFLQELTNYLDGVLDDRTKAELEDHLAWCHNCYVVCDTTKKTIEIYRDSQLYELPDDLRNRLRSAHCRQVRSPQENRPARSLTDLQSSQQTDNVGGFLLDRKHLQTAASSLHY